MYKGKYYIGVYAKIQKEGDVDETIGLFETTKAFAEFFGKTLKQAYDILLLHTKNENADLVVNGGRYELALIDMSEEA